MKLTITYPKAGTADPRIWVAEVAEPEKPRDQIDPSKIDFSKIPPGRNIYFTPIIATYEVDMAHLSVGDLGELSSYRDEITQLEIIHLVWESLDFLRYFSNIRIAWIGADVKDVTALRSLPQLQELDIRVPARLDVLGTLTTLEAISLPEWGRGAESILCLPRLRTVLMNRFPFATLQGLAGCQGAYGAKS